jgi:hypothetical protein
MPRVALAVLVTVSAGSVFNNVAVRRVVALISSSILVDVPPIAELAKARSTVDSSNVALGTNALVVAVFVVRAVMLVLMETVVERTMGVAVEAVALRAVDGVVSTFDLGTSAVVLISVVVAATVAIFIEVLMLSLSGTFAVMVTAAEGVCEEVDGVVSVEVIISSTFVTASALGYAIVAIDASALV